MSFFRRIKMWLRRGQLDRELEEEMRLHLELREREEAAAGVPPDDARAAARRRFGNVTALREESRGEWSWRWLDSLGQDVRYALRTMRRNPGFTVVAALALALGIGANTAVFTVVNAILLRPLPYARSDELVTILHHGQHPVSPANWRDWRDQSHSFSGMGAAEYFSPNLSGIDRPEQVVGLRLTSEVLPVLGVPPLLGRWFGAGDDVHSVVLSHELWRNRFGADPGIVGRPISLNGESYTVVGVMPASFRFAPFWAVRARLWAPLDLSTREGSRESNSLRVFARLAPGVTLAQARADMAAVTARLDQEFPATNRDVQVTPLLEKVTGDVRPALIVLLVAVGFVLLVACANIAHMLLARAAARQREVALRTALGADRRRLVRQFLTESIVLALVGGAAGVLLAVGAVDALVALEPESIPRVESISIDGRVLALMLGVTVAAGLAFGLLPALQTTARNLHAALRSGGARTTERGRLRGLLVASQVALALVLTAGAGLMIRSFAALRDFDPGFRPGGVLSLVVSVAGSRESAAGRRGTFYDEVVERVRSLPGVAEASAVNHVPIVGDVWNRTFIVEGRPVPGPGEAPQAVYRAVFPGYFRAMGIPLLAGRDVAGGDRLAAPPVVVVNRRLAERTWPGEDALGKRISLDDGQTWLTVIGVAGNSLQHGWGGDPMPEVALAFRQVEPYMTDPATHQSYLSLVVRARGDAAGLAAPIRQAIAALDPDVAVSQVVTMPDAVDEVTARPRFLLTLLMAFAAVALLLSAIGVYGVMSHAVAGRTQEIGIRMALGATRGDVLRLVAGQGLGFALAGVAVGLAGAFAMARLMSSLLYGVGPTDPVTFLVVPLVLCAVAAAASFVPARRATRVDPMVALRRD